MFSSKNLKVKLVYMGFGGMVAIIGMLFAIGMLSSVTAQRDKFDTIQCRRLEVVDAAGKPMVILATNEDGGAVQVNGKGEGKAVMSINEDGDGAVSTWDKNGNQR